MFSKIKVALFVASFLLSGQALAEEARLIRSSCFIQLNDSAQSIVSFSLARSGQRLQFSSFTINGKATSNDDGFFYEPAFDLQNAVNGANLFFNNDVVVQFMTDDLYDYGLLPVRMGSLNGHKETFIQCQEK